MRSPGRKFSMGLSALGAWDCRKLWSVVAARAHDSSAFDERPIASSACMRLTMISALIM